jgi:hypothetical protein
MKKGRHRRFEEARAMKRNSEIDVEAIFRIDELLDTDEEGDDIPPERAAWLDEYDRDDPSSDD